MAIIAEQVLPPPGLPPNYKRRVVVKFQAQIPKLRQLPT